MPQLIAGEVVQKVKRLGAMSPHELAHRVREKVYAELDRISINIGIGDSRPTAVAPFKSYLNGAPAGRFYRSHQQNLQPFVRQNFPEWIDQAVDEAEKLCRHEVTLLGYGAVDLGPVIDWHRDPVTGRTWERRFWADYRPVEDNGGRDPKIIHELNRHQHLPRLAKAYRLTGDERYATEAVTQLHSWIDQNPLGRGINWQSSLEIAIRALSWMWTIFPILPSRAFDAASAQRIGDSLFDQLEHVHRYTSLFSSPNTHLLGEATALFTAGLVFQDHKRPAVWLHRASRLLADAAEKQVLDDGVYGELSSCYHCYALDFYLQAIVLAQQNGFHFPEPVPQKLRDMLHFLMHLTRPDGTLPSLGDDDGGRALALDKRDYRSYQDGLCLGAILYGRPDFKYQAGAFQQEALWMLGREAWDVYSRLESQAPPDTHACYPSAGYTVHRTGWDPIASHFVFDSGGLGMLTGAHAHADALSFTLFHGGRELLVDPGTFVYNCAPEWRNYFRSTRAHNTVAIDGRDQAEQGGTFRWKSRHSVVGQAFSPVPPACGRISYLEGEHDGYLRLPYGITHRRRILCPSPAYWLVVDDFRGSGEHTFDFHYHFAPDVELSNLIRDESGVTVRADDGRLWLRMISGGAWPTSASPILAGWASRKYGEKTPCSTLRTSVRGPAPLAAMTFLIPDMPSAPPVRHLTLESGSGIACSYQHHRFVDIAVLSTGDSEMTVADFRMHGEFFWLRLEAGVLRQVLAVRACSLDRGGESIFRRSDPGSYFGDIDADSNETSLCAEFAGS